MSTLPEIWIYCDWQAPAGVERVSLRLRDMFRRAGVAADLVSASAAPVFGQKVRGLRDLPRRGATVIFSRKRDVLGLGLRVLSKRAVYWRHLPVTARGLRGWVDRAFVVVMSWRGPVVCVCDELAQMIGALPGVRARAVHVAYAPLPADSPTRVAIRTSTDARRLLYVSRPGGQKRLDLVLQHFAHARRLRPGLRLLVHGLEDEMPLPDGVSAAPEGADPRESLGTSDALLLWSDYEGFPTIMTEAALAGVPILANSFRTGRRDFERLIGPVGQLDPKAGLIDALDGLPQGTYDLSYMRDARCFADWQAVLGENGKNAIEPDNPALVTPKKA